MCYLLLTDPLYIDIKENDCLRNVIMNVLCRSANDRRGCPSWTYSIHSFTTRHLLLADPLYINIKGTKGSTNQ
jgi:hypothetical protein